MINLDEDTLWQSAIRRQMGFDFKLSVTANRVTVRSTQEPYYTTGCNVSDPLEEKDIKKIVRACIRLKNKVEGANANN